MKKYMLYTTDTKTGCSTLPKIIKKQNGEVFYSTDDIVLASYFKRMAQILHGHPVDKELYHVVVGRTQSKAAKEKKANNPSLQKYYEDIKSGAIKRDHSSVEKAVVCFTKKGAFVSEYKSLGLAERETGADKNSIRNCCNKKEGYNTAVGMIWEWK